MNDKNDKLTKLLLEMGSVAVAFSGGVDSSFLLAAASRALGNNSIAVIVRSPTMPAKEYEEAVRLAEKLKVRYRVLEANELSDPEFRQNRPDRCYLCKKGIFSAIKDAAREEGIEHVVDGSNADDVDDYRPGMKALKELGVRSLLVEAGITKDEIRKLSLSLGLPTWNKPSAACLASRIPYGEEITEERLKRIERSEAAVRELIGGRQVRVRDHNSTARIEVEPEQIQLLTDPKTREMLVLELKRAGFKYVSLDLEGYRSGAMNEVLDTKIRK